jgi:hypothetical protein
MAKVLKAAAQELMYRAMVKLWHRLISGCVSSTDTLGEFASLISVGAGIDSPARELGT